MSMHPLKQFSSFLVIGAIATAIQYVILVVLAGYAGTNPVVASTLGFAISSLVNYELNRKITFDSSTPRRTTIYKFYAVAIGGLVINSTSMWLLINLAGLHYVMAQILTTLLVLVFNFGFNKFWTFTGSGGKKHELN